MKTLLALLILIPSLSWGETKTGLPVLTKSGENIDFFKPSAWLCIPDGLTGLNWSDSEEKWKVQTFKNRNFTLSIFENNDKCFASSNDLCTSFKWLGDDLEFPTEGNFFQSGEGMRSWINTMGPEKIILNDEGDFTISFAIPLTLMGPLSEDSTGSIYVGAGKCQKIM